VHCVRTGACARRRISPPADTAYSIPAAVRVKGKTVAGYVTVETVQGFTTASPDDPAVVNSSPTLNRRALR
jgi:hypothetical protein